MMDIVVNDKTTLNPLSLVEVYDSAIWAERYRDTGDFEIEMPMNAPVLEYMLFGNYLSLLNSDRAMIIEYMSMKSDIATGKKSVVFKGRSLESILMRRIVWTQTTLDGYLFDELERLFNENLGSSADSSRRISNFRYVRPSVGSVEYDLLHDVRIVCQFTGDTLFDATNSIAEACGFGWKLAFNQSAGTFDFHFVTGTDRTINNTFGNDPIIFSPEFENLSNSNFVYNVEDYQNITLVLGEDDGTTRKRKVVWFDSEEPTGLDRRELYTDARDLQSEKEDGSTMTPEAYEKSLETRGKKKLAEKSITSAFDGVMETSIGPQYGKNFFMGDYVTTLNEFGVGSVAQIQEFVRSNSMDGYKEYPSFAMMQ